MDYTQALHTMPSVCPAVVQNSTFPCCCHRPPCACLQGASSAKDHPQDQLSPSGRSSMLSVRSSIASSRSGAGTGRRSWLRRSNCSSIYGRRTVSSVLGQALLRRGSRRRRSGGARSDRNRSGSDSSSGSSGGSRILRGLNSNSFIAKDEETATPWLPEVLHESLAQRLEGELFGSAAGAGGVRVGVEDELDQYESAFEFAPAPDRWERGRRRSSVGVAVVVWLWLCGCGCGDR